MKQMELNADFFRNTGSSSTKELTQTVLLLSIPAILAEISTIAMTYIDAAMVGSLGANATAAIGVVSSTTWLIGGLCLCSGTGFSVQVAQLVGAGRLQNARNVLRQSFSCLFLFALVLSGISLAISKGLPVWLGGDPAICREATNYFQVFAIGLLAGQFRNLAGSMLQCSGNMRTPSILNSAMCAFDVVFNWLLIFPGRQVRFLKWRIPVPGAGLGVAGAAWGTVLAQLVTALVMLWFLCVRSEKMRIFGTVEKGKWRPEKNYVMTALRIGIPMAFENSILCLAQIITTRITTPLGTVAVAANSLAVTAEGFCYMPGYGISAASTTLVGQSIGAGRKDLARKLARLSVYLGMALMTGTAAIMYFAAPALFHMLTPDPAVQELGIRVLRIECFAEPLFGASIVVTGAVRGAGDTLVPSILNLVSMWGVRITLAAFLASRLGLAGVWIAMCIELWVRGLLFLVRLYRERWLQKANII